MLYVGTSGYSFKEWVGPFYPPKTPGKDYLPFYASKLKTVEINYTFRHFPTKDRSTIWAAETPEDFKFSFKMHQSVTHEARLKEVWPSVKDFLKALDPLGLRIGIILFQLPPYLPMNEEKLSELLDQLPKDKRFAFEFRHPSWSNEKTLNLLRAAGVALCAAEREIGSEIPPLTAPYGYVRQREVPSFSDKDVSLMRREIREILNQAKDLYFYVKHDEFGFSPKIAIQLQSSET